jgi:hypothetical protein
VVLARYDQLSGVLHRALLMSRKEREVHTEWLPTAQDSRVHYWRSLVVPHALLAIQFHLTARKYQLFLVVLNVLAQYRKPVMRRAVIVDLELFDAKKLVHVNFLVLGCSQNFDGTDQIFVVLKVLPYRTLLQHLQCFVKPL